MNLLLRKYRQFKKQAFYASLIRKNELCFDIGANVGAKSRIFLSTGAKVIAFEPQSTCLKQLAQINNPNFNFYSIAVGATNKTRELHLSNYSELATLSDEFMEAHRSPDVYWNASEKVMVKSLNHLIEEFGLPDFCKIDVEGYELEIISALTYQIPLIEIEFTGKLLGDTIKIIGLLSNSLYCFNYTRNEQPKFELTHWVTAQEMIKLLNNLPKDRLHGNLFCQLQRSSNP